MNIKKGDSLIRFIERACHKRFYQGGCSIPSKSVVLKNLKKWSCAKQTTGWGCPTTLKEVGVYLVIPKKGYALKELKEGCWSKQNLGKGMN